MSGGAMRPAAPLTAAARRADPDQRAWVVFCGRTGRGWHRLLRPSFRHCFVALNDGVHWITFDPLSHRTEVTVQPVAAPVDLPTLYRRRGHIVVPAAIARPRRAAPPAPLTCVEAVKRVLGLRAFWIWTPFQLYRRLLRDHAAGPSKGAE